jgi:hypothetical protein
MTETSSQMEERKLLSGVDQVEDRAYLQLTKAKMEAQPKTESHSRKTHSSKEIGDEEQEENSPRVLPLPLLLLKSKNRNKLDGEEQ